MKLQALLGCLDAGLVAGNRFRFRWLAAATAAIGPATVFVARLVGVELSYSSPIARA
jgi:hypothetical protein